VRVEEVLLAVNVIPSLLAVALVSELKIGRPLLAIWYRFVVPTVLEYEIAPFVDQSTVTWNRVLNAELLGSKFRPSPANKYFLESGVQALSGAPR
jgi:hypothetical protein